MERREFPGAWYGENLPNGAFVVTYPDGRIETMLDETTFPGGILFARIHPHGQGCVGVGAEGAGTWKDRAVEFDDRLQNPRDRGVACGGSPCAYWPDGALVVSQCQPPYGSQGIRWIDTEIHTGDATYFDASIPLWEYTRRGLITVGQGGDGPSGPDPCLIVLGGVRYLLESGTCRFIRYNQLADLLAISFFKMDTGSHVQYWLTEGEIGSLPVYNPMPGPEPEPEPEDEMKPPIVTVAHWTLDDVLDGREFVFRDDGNPELQISARVWVQGSSMYASFTNKAGSAQTGATRTVKPCSQHPPDPGPGPGPGPGPEPEPTSQFYLQSIWGTYLSVGADKFLTLSQTAPAVFEEVEQPGGYIALLCNGKYVAAEGDNRCKADRDEPGDWEQWTSFVDTDKTTFYQSWRGFYLSAKDNGTVAADIEDAGSWESFMKQPATGGRAPITGPLTADGGRYFRDASGAAWRGKGVTAFGLHHRYADGQNIQPFLDSFPGFNYLRLFAYVTWEGTGWEMPPFDAFIGFLNYVKAQGWYVELTLLTDDDPGRIQPAIDLVNRLAHLNPKPTNLILEIGNEPTTHKNINTQALKSACDASGFLYSSGNYEDNAEWFGRFGTAHTPRDYQWSRKGHELMEYYNGGGPHYPTAPACRAPWLGDEPIRPDECNPDWWNVFQDYRAYGGVCAILGAGCLFHFGPGRYGDPPTEHERQCAAAMREGLDAFPADVPGGSYRTIDEDPYSDVETGARTYIVGERAMVRVRPKQVQCPEPGWTPIDADGVLWRR